eukprot:46881-Eustigmatos_ZCMA.PRE.1
MGVSMSCCLSAAATSVSCRGFGAPREVLGSCSSVVMSKALQSASYSPCVRSTPHCCFMRRHEPLESHARFRYEAE